MEDAGDQFIRLYSTGINSGGGEAEPALKPCCHVNVLSRLELWILIGGAFRGIYAVTRDDKTSICHSYCGQR
jgi:hypothetical protein